MTNNTKANLIISDEHQQASMPMNRRFYLIRTDKNFLISPLSGYFRHVVS